MAKIVGVPKIVNLKILPEMEAYNIRELANFFQSLSDRIAQLEEDVTKLKGGK